MRLEQKRIAVIALPLCLITTIATAGQFEYLRDHLIGWPAIGAVIFAAALESTGLALMWFSHDAQLRGDSAFRLKIGAFAVAGIIAAMNYSHWSPHGPTFVGIATGLMSLMSVTLWNVYSSRINRDALKALGLIESRAVKFGGARWFWWPRRTFPAYRHAVWTGETDPAAAIATYEADKTAREAAREAQQERQEIDPAASDASNIRIALRSNPDTASAPEIAAWLAERGVNVTPAYVRSLRSLTGRQDALQRRSSVHALPPAENSG